MQPDQQHRHPSRESAQRERKRERERVFRATLLDLLSPPASRSRAEEETGSCARRFYPDECTPWPALAKVSFGYRGTTVSVQARSASARFAFLDERNVLSLPARGGKSAQLKLSKRFTSRRSKDGERERERTREFALRDFDKTAPGLFTWSRSAINWRV